MTATKTNTCLDLVLRDFYTFSEKAFARYHATHPEGTLEENFKDERHYFWTHLNRELGAVFLYDKGIAWFGGEDISQRPFGSPEDYPSILESEQHLYEFVRATLDRGIVHQSGKNNFGSTNSADYLVWLYRNSDNQNFKSSLTSTVIELLEEELSRTHTAASPESMQSLKKDSGHGYLNGPQKTFNQEYQLLAGVLSVIAKIGKEEPALAVAYSPLLRVVKEKTFAHLPQLRYGETRVKLKDLVYAATGALSRID
jgi:hypothetical protein